jgi:hypothetical protein
MLTAILAVTMSARADESCAVVAVAQPEPDATTLAKVRESFAARCRFVTEGEVQAVLEHFERPLPIEERARDALAKAHTHMRRFDVAGVRQSLDEALRAIGELAPTAEARQLFVQWALQQAELATVAHDAAAQLRAMRLALSVEPQLRLDTARNPPATLALLAAARDQATRAPRVSVSVTSQPAGAQVWAAGWRGETPVSVDLAAGPAVIWLSRAGHHSRILETLVGSSAELHADLEPLALAERLRPSVDAVRQAAPEARRQPALALAAAAGVDAVVLVDPDGKATLIGSLSLPAPAVAMPLPSASAPTLAATSPAPRRRPWYKKAWPWVLLVGGAAAAATAVSVGVVYGPASPASLSCCR